ncbi:riboflavin synthase [Candidatus Micrarchaeota archaeon]|nr:riboflavin synthase [Candidatus Micrarchaeota archaeon]
MKIGIVDTTFSRVNMGEIALDELKKLGESNPIRRTVPGIKDLAVECKTLLDSGCDIVLALGMVGGMPIDQQCAHEASLGIQQAKLLTNKHIIEVFVHENEAWSEKELAEIFEDRIRKHVHNVINLIKNPKTLTQNAGLGVRQGKADEGSLSTRKLRIGVVVGRFNNEITDKMLDSAKKTAKRLDVELFVLSVPGVYDMPLVVKKLLLDKSISAVATLGAVVKGDTAHDEVITKDTARRLGDLSLEHHKPVALGIIGHNVSYEQADARAEDYGMRAIEAAVELISILRS